MTGFGCWGLWCWWGCSVAMSLTSNEYDEEEIESEDADDEVFSELYFSDVDNWPVCSTAPSCATFLPHVHSPLMLLLQTLGPGYNHPDDYPASSKIKTRLIDLNICNIISSIGSPLTMLGPKLSWGLVKRIQQQWWQGILHYIILVIIVSYSWSSSFSLLLSSSSSIESNDNDGKVE